MSTLAIIPTSCTSCGAVVRGQVVVVANFDRRPDLRQAVLDGRFNRLSCAQCGHEMVIARTVATFDFERMSWISCYPRWTELHRRDLAAATDAAFRRNMVSSAPPGMREIAVGMRVRVVFGLDALREQLIIQDHELDPMSVECAKLALLAGAPKRVLHRLLLWQVDPSGELTWLAQSDTGVERRVTNALVLAVPPAAHLPVGELGSDAFFSMRRFVVVPRPADPLAFDLTGASYAFAGGAQLRQPFDDTL